MLLKMPKTPLMKIPVSPGELIDKITILTIKQEKINNSEKLRHIINEIECLAEFANPLKQLLVDYDMFFNTLRDINQQLWDIEDDLRAKEATLCFDEEFIEKARLVYKTNDKRAAIKLQINQILGSNIAEQKQHPSYNI